MKAMNLTSLRDAATRFDAMTLRERAMIGSAALGALLMLWNLLLMHPLTAKQVALQAELDQISTDMATSAEAMQAALEPGNAARAQLQSAQTQLTAVDQALETAAAGMIAPERMAAVVQDVLRQQHAITLVSLRNRPVMSLMNSHALDSESAAGEDAKPVMTSPYVHRLQLVVEGSYPDIVDYLHTLETLPWRLYWNRLDLETTHYPTNRVQIELSTLSLDATWLGV